ncbi:hypothetical protein CVT24_009145 [Panaeolus cyanescens]|uniref:ubiquitinyl hydrolase 1 n=1 Tax=Panaeolus cyanescens TaxID=181874 RepID=A0A409WCP9_9AGAR|nr:hypothetical protein CVT24_009145 [Panaeolus cyanescens]
MRPPAWSIRVLKSTLFQQIAPIIVLFLIPTLVYFIVTLIRRLDPLRLAFRLYQALSMGLENLGISLPWLWSSSSGGSSGSLSSKRNKGRKRRSSSSGAGTVRTHAQKLAKQKKAQAGDSYTEDEDAYYYPGLVNISGTYCFMNSTLQAMASLSYLQPHIDAIHSKAEDVDVETPVIDALKELFKNLNTPKSNYHSLRPHNIIDALASVKTSPSNSLFNSREHQDAQELFQLVSECIKREMTEVDKEGQRDRGIAGVLDFGSTAVAGPSSPLGQKDNTIDTRGLGAKSVFDGLTANRRSCVVCGYTEAVMHFGFDNWQLAVPRLATSCRLEDCLEDYTRLEILNDCICRKCSVVATQRRLREELKTLQDALAPQGSTSASISALSSSAPMPSSSSSSSPSKSKPSNSKKKRYREVKRMEERVRNALEQGRIEDDAIFEGIRLDKVVSSASTKQAMIARPPQVLALHLNRSVHYGGYAAKNTIRVYFPEVLDLTPYTTSGSLSVVPTNAISTPSPAPTSAYAFYAQPSSHSDGGSSSQSATRTSTQSGKSNSTRPTSVPPNHDDNTASDNPRPKRPTTPTPASYAAAAAHNRTIYRLAAVVCHYGQHSFGHYICYRRKPRKVNGRWMPPTLVDPLKLVDKEEDEEGKKQKVHGQRAGGGELDMELEYAAYQGPSSTGQQYVWEDHSESEVGTGKGWLRISDDAVSEVGIESVLAEGTGVFMLYYEKAVHPRPGPYMSRSGDLAQTKGVGQGVGVGMGLGLNGSALLNGHGRGLDTDSIMNGVEGDGDPDGDQFSIGSEETLKPEMKVVDLNGSVGSLVSEVGIGVMKSPKKAKKKLLDHLHSSSPSSSSASHSNSNSHSGVQGLSNSLMYLPTASIGFQPRIVRSVNARLHRPKPIAAVVSEAPAVLVNGTAHHAALEEDEIPLDMTASAPSILSGKALASSTAHSLNHGMNGHVAGTLGARTGKVHSHQQQQGAPKIKAR